MIRPNAHDNDNDNDNAMLCSATMSRSELGQLRTQKFFTRSTRRSKGGVVMNGCQVT